MGVDREVPGGINKSLFPSAAEESSGAVTTNSPKSEPSATATQGGILRLLGFLAVGWLPALIDAGALSEATALNVLAESPQPYFLPSEAWLLYFRTPVVALSGCLLCISPGLLLALAVRRSMGISLWIVSGFGLSLLVVSAATTAIQALLDTPLRDGRFGALLVVCSLLSFGILQLRLTQKRPVGWPFDEAGWRGILSSIVLVPWLFLAVLAPKFYWQTFTGDGMDSFEGARLLFVQPVPFWDRAAGSISNFTSMRSLLSFYPISWFLRLFGEIEISARLPMVLYLTAIYAAIVGLAQHGRSRLKTTQLSLIWLGLAIYLVVMTYSNTYNTYYADLANPASLDTLAMACFLGFLLAFVRNEPFWIVLWVGLTCFSLVSGALLVGLWLLATGTLWRPRPRREMVATLTALIGAVVVMQVAPAVLTAFDLPPPGAAHGVDRVLTRFTGPQLGEWLELKFLWHEDYLMRWAFVVFPSGILPSLALLGWRRQDSVTRSVAAVTLSYYLLFYIQAYVSLHYFVPAMLLPLVVYWRTDIPGSRGRPRLFLVVTAVAGLVALYLSLPPDATPGHHARRIGAATEIRLGGYESMEPEAFRQAWILGRIVPHPAHHLVPKRSFGEAASVLYHYAHRSRTKGDINYVLQAASSPVPKGMKLLATQGDVALYVKDRAVLAEHRAKRPPTPAGSSLYVIPRHRLFQHRGPPLREFLRSLLGRSSGDP